MPADPYRDSVFIAAKPERVFEYFTRPEAVVTWMGGRAELDPRPGGEFRLYISGVPVVGRYVEVDPPRRVVITWGRGGSAAFPPGASTLEVTIGAQADGSLVQIVHRGLPEKEAAKHAVGWAHYLARDSLSPPQGTTAVPTPGKPPPESVMPSE
jgi:uncharacterized protein YndB with AHSA1/START domain